MLPGLVIGAAWAVPTLEAPAAPVAEGELLSLDFVEDAPGRVHIDGCVSFELERRAGERWVAIPVRQCGRMVAATAVDGRMTLSAPAPTPGEYRAAVTWGQGCRDGAPLALAACTVLDVAWSEAFTVHRRR